MVTTDSVPKLREDSGEDSGILGGWDVYGLLGRSR